MDMNMSSSPSYLPPGVDPCYVGYHNGTWPDGTLGGGTWAFGHYVPTTIEDDACQAVQGPWAVSVKYGLWTTWFIVAAIGISAFFNWTCLLSRLPRKVSALGRVIAYPRATSALPALGTMLFICAFTVFGLVVMFGIRPYYRPPNFGSSPLGLRSEWIATALVPWILAASLKHSTALPNPLSLQLLARIPSPTLLTLHKYGGWACLVASVVHTVAMMWRAHLQAPWAHTWATNVYYGWRAWAALVALAWICVLSLPPVRRAAYEVFYVLHILGMLFFVVTMYLHLGNALGSWSYMHATVIVFGVGLLFRIAGVLLNHGFFTLVPRAQLTNLADGAIKLTIPVPCTRTWSPGQFVLIRFLTIRPWETHPFTVASLPSQPNPSQSGNGDGTHDMEFVIRPMHGLTARLRTLVEFGPGSGSSASLPVLLDGPFAQMHGGAPRLARADNVLLVAGGSGMSSLLPALLHLAHLTTTKNGGSPRSSPHQKVDAEEVRRQQVALVWTARHASAFSWFRDALHEARAAFAKGEEDEGALRVRLHVTQQDRDAAALSTTDILPSKRLGLAGEDTGSSKSADTDVGLEYSLGRPDVARTVHEAAAGTSGTLVVVSCGPESLLLAVRNAVAREQINILRGTVQAREVVLVEEMFEF